MNADALAQDPFFPRLKALVIDVTGMAFYADKDADLAQIVADRMTQRGVGSVAAYLEILAADAEEMDSLVAELTIGETYFFRHKEQFDALRDVILPDILARNSASRRLRIWSAGCATGPEPYSLAMVLRREFGPRILGWDVSILATDINRHFLDRGREGRYDQWAFRALPESLLRDCFVPVGRQWQIRPEYRAMVSFQHHNLTSARFPTVTDSVTGFDLIICRNVVIYFSRETVEDLIPRFHASLSEGGWLVVGHAEPNQELFRAFRTVNYPGTVLYQRGGGDDPMPAGSAPPRRPPAPPRVPVPVPPARAVAPSPVAVPPPPASDDLAQVRHLADQGQWDQALSACDRVLAVNALDWRPHYLRALILEQGGDRSGCEAALRRAIYLDRRAVLPHYHLGLVLLRADDGDGAWRSFRNVLALLDGQEDGQPIDMAEGLDAGQLRETVMLQMKTINPA